VGDSTSQSFASSLGGRISSGNRVIFGSYVISLEVLSSSLEIVGDVMTMVVVGLMIEDMGSSVSFCMRSFFNADPQHCYRHKMPLTFPPFVNQGIEGGT
jgi:hypothetical protein